MNVSDMHFLTLLLIASLTSSPLSSEEAVDIKTLQETIAVQKKTILELHDDLRLTKNSLDGKEREISFLRDQVVMLEGYPDKVRELTDALDLEKAATLVLRTQLESFEQIVAGYKRQEEGWKADKELLIAKELTINDALAVIDKLKREKSILKKQVKTFASNIEELHGEIASFGDIYETVQNERLERIANETKVKQLEALLANQKDGLEQLEESRAVLEGELFKTRTNYVGLLKRIRERGSTNDPQLTAWIIGEQKTHIVQKGETLSNIAKKYYGNNSRWNKIYEANKSVIPDKDHIRVGTTLVIPE